MSLIKENPSIISKNLSIVGDLKSNGTIEIEGEVKGNITTEVVSIRDSGKVNGDIKAKIINIKGIFDGKAYAEKINISENAKITGELEYQSLAVDYGASINCQLKRIEIQSKGIFTKASKEVKEDKKVEIKETKETK